jgi:hypothetical protein
VVILNSAAVLGNPNPHTVIGAIGAPTYRPAKHLASVLGPHLGNFLHHVRSSENLPHIGYSLGEPKGHPCQL